MAVKLRAVIDTNVLFEGVTQRGALVVYSLTRGWQVSSGRTYLILFVMSTLMCLRASFPQDDSLKLFIWSMNS